MLMGLLMLHTEARKNNFLTFKCLLQIAFSWSWVISQQCIHRHDNTRSAETALRTVRVSQSLLEYNDSEIRERTDSEVQERMDNEIRERTGSEVRERTDSEVREMMDSGVREMMDSGV